MAVPTDDGVIYLDIIPVSLPFLNLLTQLLVPIRDVLLDYFDARNDHFFKNPLPLGTVKLILFVFAKNWLFLESPD